MSSPLGSSGVIGRRIKSALQRFADFTKWNSQVGALLDRELNQIRDISVSLPRKHAETHKGGDDTVIDPNPPVLILVGGGALAGTPANGAAPSGHRHAAPAGTPVAIGAANAAGSSGLHVHSDHVHALEPSLLLTLGAAVWFKYTVTHAALQAAALNNDIELFSLPAKGVIHAYSVKHSVAFAGTGITGYTLSLGITGDLTRYAPAFNVLQAPGNTVFQTGSVHSIENFGAATSVRLAAVSTGANLDQSAAGSVDVYVLRSLLP